MYVVAHSVQNANVMLSRSRYQGIRNEAGHEVITSTKEQRKRRWSWPKRQAERQSKVAISTWNLDNLNDG
ncbi:hypothetical protein BGW80DRAFT_817170 [Lactifluus volemus]|nr:hypothetical protein BGW80DRAFT_817170 [Lactifluus volemus]